MSIAEHLKPDLQYLCFLSEVKQVPSYLIFCTDTTFTLKDSEALGSLPLQSQTPWLASSLSCTR